MGHVAYGCYGTVARVAARTCLARIMVNVLDFRTRSSAFAIARGASRARLTHVIVDIV
jgi:hypothetical protein